MDEKIKTIFNSEKEISSMAEEFYKDYWTDSDKVKDITIFAQREIIKKFFPKGLKNKTIVEIGVGGEGGVINQLKEYNSVVGIDVSDSALRNLERFGIEGLKANMDKDEIPLEDNYADIVFAFEVFENFANPQHAIGEIKRILKDNGILLISVPNKYTYHWPRIFYPSLYDDSNFADFLMANEFTAEILDDFIYTNTLKDLDLPFKMKSHKKYFFSHKISKNNSEELYKLGMHFWEKKDDKGIRLSPIEACDLFFKSYSADNTNLDAMFHYTHTLLFRFLYSDKEKFLEMFNSLSEILNNIKDDNLAKYLYYFLLISYEAKLFDIDLLKSGALEELTIFLQKADKDGKYYNNLIEEIERFENLKD